MHHDEILPLKKMPLEETPLTPVSERVTILMVTSPILSHPSTELMERVVSSFSLVSSLSSCQMLLLADGVKCGKFRPKRGMVPTDMVTNYNLYLDRLEELVNNSDS